MVTKSSVILTYVSVVGHGVQTRALATLVSWAWGDELVVALVADILSGGIERWWCKRKSAGSLWAGNCLSLGKRSTKLGDEVREGRGRGGQQAGNSKRLHGDVFGSSIVDEDEAED